MSTLPGISWAVRGAAFALWALAAGSAVYWGLKLSARAQPVAAPVPLRATAPPDGAAVARLLGASPTAQAAPAPTLASRFALVGVAAQGSHGAALIAVDGKPPRPYRVGTQVDEGLVLQSVKGKQAVLAPDMKAPPVVTLDMPALRR